MAESSPAVGWKSMRRSLALQAPWFLVVVVAAVTNGLIGNGYVHLVGAAAVVAYGLLLIANYRGVAVLPPWGRSTAGRITGVFVLVIGVALVVGAAVTIAG